MVLKRSRNKIFYLVHGVCCVDVLCVGGSVVPGGLAMPSNPVSSVI